MPQAVTSQTTFSAGELDPRLVARHDYEAFYKGAETLTNVVCLGQGGVKRRQGLRFVGDLGESNVRFVEFEFNITQTYLLVFAPNKMYVYKDGVQQTNINGSGNDYMTTTYSAAQLPELGWTQSADTLIMCHKSHAVAKIVRGASHTTWTKSNISFSYLPTFDFNADYDNATFTPQSSSYVVGDTAQINISGGSPLTADHVNGMFEGNDGVIRINSVNVGAQTFTGELLKEFLNNNGIAGIDASLEEPAWSAGHGYPGVATFHEGRLWFSNSTGLPQSLWGSVTGDFFNFNRGSGRDDQSIDVTLDTDSVNAILYLVSGTHLQVFTTGGEFHVPDRPIKPSNMGVLRQTRFGALPSVRPLNVDGATVFIQRNGKQVREFLFTYAEDSYNSTEINLLAPHLTNNPVAMASLTGDVINEGNYIYIVNGDGTMATFITNRAENVQAWTKFTTEGTIMDVAVVEDVVYVYVKRTINSVVKYYVEALTHDYYTDSAVQVSGATHATTFEVTLGTNHLDGQECRVRVDGYTHANKTPVAGKITLDKFGTDVEVGLEYALEIKTMPVNIQFQSGPINTKMRRILKVSAQLYEASGISINGKALPVRNFGIGVLGTGISSFTGIKTVPLLGYSKSTQVTVTQSDPMPMTLLGLTLEVQARG